MSFELHTPRLTLRPAEERDRAAWTAMMLASEDAFARSGMVIDHTLNPNQRFDQFLEKIRSGLQNRTHYRFQAFLSPGQPDAGRMIGGAALNNVVLGAFQNADMGWGIRTEYEGRNLAFETCSAVLTFAFTPPPEGLGLHRVQANVMPRNDRSLRLAARLGFRPEGLALQMLHIMGVWEDHLMHAKLAHEHTEPTPSTQPPRPQTPI